MDTRRVTASWTCAAITAAALAMSRTVAAAGLDVRVKEVRVPAGMVVATIEIRDVIPDKFRHVLDDGGALHLRVQAELWESRPVWDRLVYPALVQVLRFARVRTSRQITVANSAGGEAAYAAVPDPFALDLPIGKADRVARDVRYYVHVIATLGSLPERDVDEVGDAVFGRPNEVNGLGAFGRMLFRKMIEISDYLQSETAETKSRPAKLSFP
jgi:hypothetical protein